MLKFLNFQKNTTKNSTNSKKGNFFLFKPRLSLFMCYPVNSIFSILRAILYEKEYIFVYLDTFSESLVSAGFRNTNLATKKILRLWEYNVAITDHSQTIRKTIAGCDCPGNEKYYVITITRVIVFNSIYSQPIKC